MKTGCITTGMILTALFVCVPAFGYPIGSPLVHTGPGGHRASAGASIDPAVSGGSATSLRDNTSSLLASEGNPVSPAIAGLGFDAAESAGPTDLRLPAWAFILGQESRHLTGISPGWRTSAGSAPAGTGGQRFDLVLRTDRSFGAGLVDPGAPGGTTSSPFEAAAQIMLVFTVPPGDLLDWYLRFQDFGRDGEPRGTAPRAPVPEPGTMLLLGTGLISIIGLKKRME